jgi:hypothetical protein
MEFLDIKHLTKDSSLLPHAIHSPFYWPDSSVEFVNLLWSPGIDSQPGGILGSLNVYKFGLWKLLTNPAHLRLLELGNILNRVFHIMTHSYMCTVMLKQHISRKKG